MTTLRSFSLDAGTGAELWRLQAGGQIAAAQMTYDVDGRQYFAVAAGHSTLAFTLPQSVSRKGHKVGAR